MDSFRQESELERACYGFFGQEVKIMEKNHMVFFSQPLFQFSKYSKYIETLHLRRNWSLRPSERANRLLVIS